MAADSIRAFSNPNYDYYRLTKDLGFMKAGTIFYHDPDDHVYGSIAEGCLKNCWEPDGNCELVCGGCVILHYAFVDTDLFEKVEINMDNIAAFLRPGSYELKVSDDGSWRLYKHGSAG